MSDETRLKITRWICVTVLLFGTFIWPTPFTYVHAGRVVYMVLRFTGWHWFVCFGPS
jgi:hypothetical protein